MPMNIFSQNQYCHTDCVAVSVVPNVSDVSVVAGSLSYMFEMVGTFGTQWTRLNEMVGRFVTDHGGRPFGEMQGGASHATTRYSRAEKRRAAQAPPPPAIPSPAPTGSEQAGSD